MSKGKEYSLSLVREMLESGEARTQRELQANLKRAGVDVSQATISRALKELGYARAPVGGGSYRLQKVKEREEHIDIVLRLGLERIVQVGNLIVIKTRPGNAQTVAGAIDRTGLSGIIATIGGDDTILGITKDEPSARRVVKNLKKMLA
jgi:transcriptional regulator of arginine metabolism